MIVLDKKVTERKTDLKLKFGLWGIIGIVLMSLVLLQGQNSSLTEFGIHYRLETCKGVKSADFGWQCIEPKSMNISHKIY